MRGHDDRPVYSAALFAMGFRLRDIKRMAR